MGQSPESVVLIPSEEICSFCSFIILFDIPRGLRLTFEFLLAIALSSSSLKSSLISKRVVKITMNDRLEKEKGYYQVQMVIGTFKFGPLEQVHWCKAFWKIVSFILSFIWLISVFILHKAEDQE